MHVLLKDAGRPICELRMVVIGELLPDVVIWGNEIYIHDDTDQQGKRAIYVKAVGVINLDKQSKQPK